jgi:hypothetical protein
LATRVESQITGAVSITAKASFAVAASLTLAIVLS